MGMFDSMYDAGGKEWQTKAYDSVLARYRIGDSLPYMGTDSYQAIVLGSVGERQYGFSYATVLNTVLTEIENQRNEALPLLDYHGGWLAKEEV